MVHPSSMPMLITPFKEAAYYIGILYFKVKSFVLSQKFIWLMALSSYIDAPNYMWDPFVDFWKRLLKQPFIAVYFRDTSKKLSVRFIEKKKHKIYTLYVLIIEVYVLHVDIWRKFIVYWESERWIMCFSVLSIALYLTYRMNTGYIYCSKQMDRLLQESEWRFWNDRKRFRRWKYLKVWRWYLKRYLEYMIIPQNWTFRYCYRHNQFYRELGPFWNLYKYEYFFAHSKINNKGFIRFLYIAITIGYLGMLWHYDFYLHKHLVEIMYSGLEDNIFLHDPKDDDRRIGLDYWWFYLFNRWVSWWHLIYLQINFLKFYTLAKQVRGNIWFFNTTIIYNQKVRRTYWLKYEKRFSDLEKNGYPQLYHFEPTTVEINDYCDNEQHQYEVLQKKIEQRKLKNHWFIKKLKNFFKKTNV